MDLVTIVDTSLISACLFGTLLRVVCMPTICSRSFHNSFFRVVSVASVSNESMRLFIPSKELRIHESSDFIVDVVACDGYDFMFDVVDTD